MPGGSGRAGKVTVRGLSWLSEPPAVIAALLRRPAVGPASRTAAVNLALARVATAKLQIWLKVLKAVSGEIFVEPAARSMDEALDIGRHQQQRRLEDG